MTRLRTARWADQVAGWPAQGRHLMAQYDAASIVVYQAYRPEIAEAAVREQRFVDPFSLDRMSWVKPNFLWMTYRCGWATKPDQERVLAVRLPREAFDSVLAEAVPSSHDPARWPDREDWRRAVAGSRVRLQWDPDHDPHGNPLSRRAIQLGLRGEVLRRYALDWPVEIEDVTGFVAEQREVLRAGRTDELLVPVEEPYPCPEELR